MRSKCCFQNFFYICKILPNLCYLKVGVIYKFVYRYTGYYKLVCVHDICLIFWGYNLFVKLAYLMVIRSQNIKILYFKLDLLIFMGWYVFFLWNITKIVCFNCKYWRTISLQCQLDDKFQVCQIKSDNRLKKYVSNDGVATVK